jgi:hypothetical protein
MSDIWDSRPDRCSLGDRSSSALEWKAYWISQPIWTFRRRDKSVASAWKWQRIPRTSSLWPNQYTEWCMPVLSAFILYNCRLCKLLIRRVYRSYQENTHNHHERKKMTFDGTVVIVSPNHRLQMMMKINSDFVMTVLTWAKRNPCCYDILILRRWKYRLRKKLRL